MRAQLHDLDTTMEHLRSAAAARLAARRAAWAGMTPRQRRRLTKAAIHDFELWLADRRQERGSRGRVQPA